MSPKSKNLIQNQTHGAMWRKAELAWAASLALGLSTSSFAATQSTPTAATAETTNKPSAQTASTSTASKTDIKAATDSGPQGLSKYLGLNYFTFFDGPGFNGDPLTTPGSLGRPADDGWSLWTNLSARGKFSSNLALDVQFRLQQIITNEFQFRFQGARFGISGTLLKLNNDTFDLVWSGAVNTDLPMIGGQIVSERTLIANPGMFSNLTFRPKGSKFSIYSLIGPRLFIYSDPDAMDGQTLRAGAAPGQKPQLAIVLSPSLNYDITEKTAARAGVGIDLRRNMNDAGIRRWFMPVDFGVSHQFNKYISIYPHVRFSGPWDDDLRKSLNAAPGTDWYDTASIGMWINGTLF